MYTPVTPFKGNPIIFWEFKVQRFALYSLRSSNNLNNAVILGLYKDYIGIMEGKMGTTIILGYIGIYWGYTYIYIYIGLPP